MNKYVNNSIYKEPVPVGDKLKPTRKTLELLGDRGIPKKIGPGRPKGSTNAYRKDQIRILEQQLREVTVAASKLVSNSIESKLDRIISLLQELKK